MPNYVLYSLPWVIISFSCIPIQNYYLQNVKFDYKNSGFLDPNTFQVFCKIKPIDSYVVLKNQRKFNIAKCRNTLLKKMFEFRFQMMITQEKRKNFSHQIQKKTKNIKWNSNLEKKLILAWKNFLPGRIVHEEFDENQLIFVYRLERKNLYSELSKVSIPFDIKKYQ